VFAVIKQHYISLL